MGFACLGLRLLMLLHAWLQLCIFHWGVSNLDSFSFSQSEVEFVEKSVRLPMGFHRLHCFKLLG